MGVSSMLSRIAKSLSEDAAKTSSSSHELVLAWCLPCEMAHAWYGTSSAECCRGVGGGAAGVGWWDDTARLRRGPHPTRLSPAAPRPLRAHPRTHQHQPHGVVEPLVVGEGLVAALVRDDPHARHEGALHVPQRRPRRHLDGGGQRRAVERIHGGTRCGDLDKVHGEVREAPQGGALKQLLGDGGAHLRDAKGRRHRGRRRHRVARSRGALRGGGGSGRRRRSRGSPGARRGARGGARSHLGKAGTGVGWPRAQWRGTGSAQRSLDRLCLPDRWACVKRGGPARRGKHAAGIESTVCHAAPPGKSLLRAKLPSMVGGRPWRLRRTACAWSTGEPAVPMSYAPPLCVMMCAPRALPATPCPPPRSPRQQRRMRRHTSGPRRTRAAPSPRAGPSRCAGAARGIWPTSPSAAPPRSAASRCVGCGARRGATHTRVAAVALHMCVCVCVCVCEVRVLSSCETGRVSACACSVLMLEQASAVQRKPDGAPEWRHC